MCLFDHDLRTCDHWQWSTFQGQCLYEDRSGGVYQLKLVSSTERENTTCASCSELEKNARLISAIEFWKGSTSFNAIPNARIVQIQCTMASIRQPICKE
ncbi:hypothetical protein LZ30DRAFT_400786 [Colletotrichum cereale]|nr:hypothetical protein LZ30DRAFT_400786 [Colletotrichum cereale]